ncbi:MAG: hypothetical protein AABY07_10315 [Nanoarchaeota archaeon]
MEVTTANKLLDKSIRNPTLDTLENTIISVLNSNKSNFLIPNNPKLARSLEDWGRDSPFDAKEPEKNAFALLLASRGYEFLGFLKEAGICYQRAEGILYDAYLGTLKIRGMLLKKSAECHVQASEQANDFREMRFRQEDAAHSYIKASWQFYKDKNIEEAKSCLYKAELYAKYARIRLNKFGYMRKIFGEYDRDPRMR